MALFSPPLPTSYSTSCAKTQLPHKPLFASLPRRSLSLFIARSADNGTGAVSAVTVEEKLESKEDAPVATAVKEEKKKMEGLGANNGASIKPVAAAEAPKFKDPRWVQGTWDLEQFKKAGSTDWDAVIDAGEVWIIAGFA